MSSSPDTKKPTEDDELQRELRQIGMPTNPAASHVQLDFRIGRWLEDNMPRQRPDKPKS